MSRDSRIVFCVGFAVFLIVAAVVCVLVELP
jgi:hypothetical protein